MKVSEAAEIFLCGLFYLLFQISLEPRHNALQPFLAMLGLATARQLVRFIGKAHELRRHAEFL